MSRSRSLALPLLLTLALVGGLAPASLAQDDVTPSAGLNADKVDGKDAVAATGKAAQRANKLVATNKQGLLPANILRPLWSLLQGIPAVLADGQVSWGEVANPPAGFADGVDDAGVTGVKLTKSYGPLVSVPVNDSKTATADCPSDSRVTGGGFSVTFADKDTALLYSLPEDADTWIIGVSNFSDTHTFSIRAVAVCMSVEPAGALTVASKGVAPAKLKKQTKRGRQDPG
jgi:hypothetical protein